MIRLQRFFPVKRLHFVQFAGDERLRPVYKELQQSNQEVIRVLSQSHERKVDLHFPKQP